MSAPYSLVNPPQAPKKGETQERRNLGWWEQRNLAREFEVERRREEREKKQQLVFERRKKETQERLRWMREDFKEFHRNGPIVREYPYH